MSFILVSFLLIWYNPLCTPKTLFHKIIYGSTTGLCKFMIRMTAGQICTICTSVLQLLKTKFSVAIFVDCDEYYDVIVLSSLITAMY